MTHIDTGTLGAKVQSWRKDNPRSLLKRMMEESPRTSKEKLLQEFTDYVRNEGADYLNPIIEYWFSNNWHSLVEKSQDALKAQRAERQEKTEALKKSIKEKAVHMVLLDITMPNGKKLRYCTGRDCTRAGGWFAKIAKKVGTAGVVGKLLSEEDVQAMFQQGAEA